MSNTPMTSLAQVQNGSASAPNGKGGVEEPNGDRSKTKRKDKDGLDSGLGYMSDDSGSDSSSDDDSGSDDDDSSQSDNNNKGDKAKKGGATPLGPFDESVKEVEFSYPPQDTMSQTEFSLLSAKTEKKELSSSPSSGSKNGSSSNSKKSSTARKKALGVSTSSNKTSGSSKGNGGKKRTKLSDTYQTNWFNLTTLQNFGNCAVSRLTEKADMVMKATGEVKQVNRTSGAKFSKGAAHVLELIMLAYVRSILAESAVNRFEQNGKKKRITPKDIHCTFLQRGYTIQI